MYIKSINNVVGYKDLPDGFNIEFNENKTYIVGANFQRKTTVGSLFNWCLTGTSLNGKEKEQVANDTKRVSNVIVDITFVDNFGIEHRLIRDKGKEIHLTLDGKEIKQENLAQFYKNKDIFLVAHNPYYFWTLEPKEQKDLVRNILPIIDSEETFELLNEYEQQVIKEPIENLSSYTDARNADIDRLGKEYNKNIGKIETLRSIALEQEGCLLEFTREQELKDLQEKYESISMNFDNSNLEDLKRNIEGINRRLQEIIKEDLEKISEQYNRENKKLKQVENEHPICPSCRQEIKDNEAGEHLKQFFQNEMNRFQEKANELKETAKKLAEEKKEKQAFYEKLSTYDMKELQTERDNIKEKIDNLLKEKNDILFHNQDVTIADLERMNQNDLTNYLFFLDNTLENISKTRNRKLASMKRLYEYLETNNLINVNPTKWMQSATIEKRQPKYLDLNESKQLLANAINSDCRYKIRNYAITCLFLNCSLRLSELVGINLSDLKIDNSEQTLKVTGKGNKQRIIYLNSAVCEAINAYIKIRPKLDKSNKDYNALFLSSRGKRISKRSVQNIIKSELVELVEAEGKESKKYHTHTLRHTGATLLYNEANANIFVLKIILGHESLDATQVYTHVSDKKLKELMQNFNILDRKE